MMSNALVLILLMPSSPLSCRRVRATPRQTISRWEYPDGIQSQINIRQKSGKIYLVETVDRDSKEDISDVVRHGSDYSEDNEKMQSKTYNYKVTHWADDQVGGEDSKKKQKSSKKKQNRTVGQRLQELMDELHEKEIKIAMKRMKIAKERQELEKDNSY